jgi:hypothetical protein
LLGSKMGSARTKMSCLGKLLFSHASSSLSIKQYNYTPA